jgi:23S rRNA pseudouridine1911/1915/1917 synthase
VQHAHRGWHILGDARYGARRPMKDRSIGLWARRISFVHPVTGETLTLYAPAPNGSVWNAVIDLPLTGFPAGKN